MSKLLTSTWDVFSLDSSKHVTQDKKDKCIHNSLWEDHSE